MSVRYTIEFEYTTGDSFTSEETTGELGISWENLDRAKEALARIREMDEVEREIDRARYGLPNGKEPRRIEDCKGYTNDSYARVSILLPLDDGTEHRHSTFWRGFFEHLHVARIVRTADSNKDDDDMVYDARRY